jgi:hypothetical protein
LTGEKAAGVTTPRFARPGPVAQARYRVRQFVRAATARIQPEERAAVEALLPPAALQLFDRMPRDAQRHSINVMQALQSAGMTDPELLTAALLHDVGKVAADEAGVRINMWLRGPLVLAETFAPQRLARTASDNVHDGWRFALHVHLDHPAIGAAWLAEAGLSPLTCRLVARHQDKHFEVADPSVAEMLAALQWADSIN